MSVKEEPQGCHGQSRFGRRLRTRHFTVLKDQQDGNGLDTLSQALEEVWVLQDSEIKIKKDIKKKTRSLSAAAKPSSGWPVRGLPVRVALL